MSQLKTIINTLTLQLYASSIGAVSSQQFCAKIYSSLRSASVYVYCDSVKVTDK